jgi:CheY-like chemotaxis protein
MIRESGKTTVGEVKQKNSDAGAKNILVVDDERFIVSVIAKSLSIYLKASFHILTAENGAEAVEILKAHPAVLIVTDLNMPIMNGYELSRYLKGNHPDTPVFLMTSDLTSKVEERLRLMGVREFFEKPFSVRKLALKIADELEDEWGGCTYEETLPSVAPGR